VTHNSTRKQFFARLLGVVAVTSVFPKLFGRTVSSAAAPSTSSTAAVPFEIRHDGRAVARRDVI
jgi:hypothetical protein